MLESEVWGRACGGLNGGNTWPDLLFKEFLDCRRVRMMKEDQAGGYYRSPSDTQKLRAGW